MAGPESLAVVRTRIGLQIAEIQTRATKLKPVDICAKMAAIRAMAAQHAWSRLRGSPTTALIMR